MRPWSVESAWEVGWECVVRHRQAIERGCRSSGCRGPDLEDACQEGILRAAAWICRHIEQARDLEEPWFFAVGRRTGLDHHRRTARRRSRERSLDVASEGREGPGAEDQSPLFVLLHKEDERALRQALHRLPEPERQVIDALVFGGLNLREAGQVSGTSRTMIQRRYRRALGLLRQALEECNNAP